MNGVTTIQSGYPFSVAIASDIANTSPGGTERASIVGAASADCATLHKNCIRWFLNQAQYTYGDTGRNILRGPGLIDFDTSFFKNFHFKERATFQLRGEFFNFFNTPAFSNPGATFGTGSFGTVGSTSNNNRQIQIAMKLIF